jgi:hypothetical protein
MNPHAHTHKYTKSLTHTELRTLKRERGIETEKQRQRVCSRIKCMSMHASNVCMACMHLCVGN